MKQGTSDGTKHAQTTLIVESVMPVDFVSRLTRPFGAQGSNRRSSRHALRAFTSGAVAVTLCAGLIGSAPSAQATNAITLTASAATVAPGATVDLTAGAPVAQAGSTTQEITQTIDPTKVKLTAASDITYPAGWALSFSTDGTTFTSTAPTTTAGWATIAAVKATGTVDSQGESAGRQVASRTSTGALSTAASVSTSGSGGDGWDVFFDAGYTRVFGRPHHRQESEGLMLTCFWLFADATRPTAERAAGSKCGNLTTFFLNSSNGFTSSDRSTGWVDSRNRLWLEMQKRSGTDPGYGFACYDISGPSPTACAVGLWHRLDNPGTFRSNYNDVMDMAAVGGKVFTTTATGKVLCLDTSATTPTACPGQPYALAGIPSIMGDGGLGGDIKVVAGKLFLLRTNDRPNVPSAGQAICIDPGLITTGATATSIQCAGWPATPPAVGSGPWVVAPNASGQPIAVCGVTNSTCVSVQNGSTTVPGLASNLTTVLRANNAGSMDSRRAFGNSETSGSRVYWTSHAASATPGVAPGVVLCFDAATNALCSGWPVRERDVYSVRLDPANPRCIWTNADTGAIRIRDGLTGALGCTSTSPIVSFPASASIPRMACTVNSGIESWVDFRIAGVGSADRRWDSARLTVRDPSGTALSGWDGVLIPDNGILSLTSLPVSGGSGSSAWVAGDLDFRVMFDNPTYVTAPQATITAVGDAPQLCTRVTAVAVCPVALGPVDSAALLPGTLNATGSGSSTASGTTTPFTSDSEMVAISAPTAAQCGSTLTGRAGDATLGSAGSPVPGVTVSLLDSSGVAISYPSDYSTVALRGLPMTQTTSASGTYSFGYLTPGSYKVSFPTTGTATSTSATVVSGAAGSLLTTTTAVSGTSTSAVDVLVVGTNGVVNGLYVIAAAATADTSTGKQGTAQSITPLSNDTASTGATYSGGSTALRLCGTGQTYPSCTATSLVVSGQGSYSISGTTMTFTPCSGVNTPVMTPACSGAFTGVASAVNYQSTDSLGRTATSTVTPTVVPVPVATADTSTGAWNTPQSITPLSNDLRGNAYDTSHPLLASTMGICAGSVTLASSCTGTSTVTTVDGTYSLNTSTGVVTFTPSASFTGTVTAPIKYAAADSQGQRVIASITPTVTSPPNPSAASESKVVSAGSSVAFTTLTGSSGLATPGTAGGPAFTTSQTSLCGVSPAETAPNCTKTSVTVSGGTYTLNRTTGVVTFAANSNASAGAQTAITYVVKDALNRTASATLTPTVPGPPAVVADSGTGAWDTNQTFSPLANDSSATSTLVTSSLKLCGVSPVEVSPSCTKTTLTVTGQGTYTVNSGGTVTFDPEPGFAVSGTTAATPVSYQVSDANGLTSSTTITPTVTPPANPVAADQSKTVIPGQTATFSPLMGAGGLSTSGGPALSSVCLIVSGACDSDGTVVIAGEGTWVLNPSTNVPTFTPCSAAGVPDASCAGPFNGTPTPMTYRVTDAVGHTDDGVLTATIPPAPSAVNDVSRGEQGSPQTGSLLANDAAGTASAPLDAASLKICAVGATPCTSTNDITVAGEGTYRLNSNGTVTFTPDAAFTGTATGVAYTVTDSLGRTASATYTPTVLPRPAPIAYPDAKSGAYGSSLAFSPLSSTNASAADSAGSQPANTSTTFVTGLTLDSSTLRLCASGEVPPNCTATSVTTVDGTYSLSGGTVTFTGVSTFSGTATAPVTYQVANAYTTTVVDPASTTTSAPTTTDPTATCMATPGCTVNVVNDADGTAPDGTGGTTPGYTPTWTTTQAAVVSTTNGSQVASSTITPTITVPAIAAVADTATTPWNTPVTDNVLSDDTFAGTIAAVSATLKLCGPNDAGTCAQTSVTISGQGTYDVVTVSGVQRVQFTPLASFTGVATAVTYAATDRLGRTVTSTFTPTVSPPAGPTAATDARSLIAGGSANFATLLAGQGKVSAGANPVQDPATCLLTPGTSSCAPSNTVVTADGTYELDTSTGIVRFTAASGAASGALTPVSYRVTDSFGMTATSTLTPTIYARPAVVAKTSADLVDTTQAIVNLLAGSTKDAAATLAPSGLYLCDTAAGDVTPDCTARTVTLAGYGTFALDPASGDVTFAPVSGYTGSVPALTFSATDSLGQKSHSTITVTVNPLPTPSAIDDTASGTVGDTLVFQPDTNDSAGTNSSSVSGLALDPTSIRLCDVMPNAQTPPNCTATTVTTADGTYTLDATTGAVTFVGASGFTGTATNPVRYQISNTYTANGSPGSATTSALLIPSLTPAPAGGGASPAPSSSDAPSQETSTVPGTEPGSAPDSGTSPSSPAADESSGPVLVPQQAVTVVDPDRPVVLDPLADAVPTPGERFRPGTVRIWDGDSWVRTHTEPGVGTWTVVDGRVEFMPAPGFTGTATIRVKATDTAGATARAVLRVKVTPRAGGPVSRPAGARPGLVPSVIDAGIQARAVGATGRDCPGVVGGRTVAWITVAQVTVPIKAVSITEAGVLAPPDSAKVAAVSTRHASLDAAAGTSVLTWHARFGEGCDGDLNVLLDQPVGSTFTITTLNGQATRYRITDQVSVAKGRHQAAWFTQTGPRRLTLLTCDGLTGDRFTRTAAIFATPLPPT